MLGPQARARLAPAKEVACRDSKAEGRIRCVRLADRSRTVFAVPRLLPQQQLVLELLRMSGEIAVLESSAAPILRRTLEECRSYGWIRQTHVSPGVFSVSLAESGRRQLEAAATQ